MTPKDMTQQPKKIAEHPSIFVTFEILDDEIYTTALSLPEEPGFWCAIKGDPCSKSLMRKINRWLAEYAASKQPKVELPFSLGYSPPFMGKVLAQLRAIPFGRAISYQGLASLAGNQRACRAAGGACKRNPLPLLVPCHRVLAEGEGLGGFSQGLEIKRRLLAYESISFHACA